MELQATNLDVRTKCILYKFVKNTFVQAQLAKYKPFLFFLGKFILCYALLAGVYKAYLNGFEPTQTDGMTNLVANQTRWLISQFNSEVSILPHSGQPSIKLYYNYEYVARIVEGCNAVSVMILFVAFVVAFTGKLRTTVLFLLGGCLLIHLLNIARIAALAAALHHFPAQEHLLHDILFPLAIYGVVFLLWMLWVNKFSRYAQGADKA